MGRISDRPGPGPGGRTCVRACVCGLSGMSTTTVVGVVVVVVLLCGRRVKYFGFGSKCGGGGWFLRAFCVKQLNFSAFYTRVLADVSNERKGVAKMPVGPFCLVGQDFRTAIVYASAGFGTISGPHLLSTVTVTRHAVRN